MNSEAKMSFVQPIISITDNFIEIKIPKEGLGLAKKTVTDVELSKTRAEKIWAFMNMIGKIGRKSLDLTDYLRAERSSHF